MAETALRKRREMAGSVRLEPMSTEMVEMQMLAASCLILPLVLMARTAAAAQSLLASSWAPRGTRCPAYLSQQRSENNWKGMRVVGSGSEVQD